MAYKMDGFATKFERVAEQAARVEIGKEKTDKQRIIKSCNDHLDDLARVYGKERVGVHTEWQTSPHAKYYPLATIDRQSLTGSMGQYAVEAKVQ